MKRTFIFVGLSLILSVSVFAQAKKKTAKKPVKKTTDVVVAVKSAPVSTPNENPLPNAAEISAPTKKNERPETELNDQEKEPKKKNQADRNKTNAKAAPEKIKYPYVYEFSQPNFVVSHIVIEHDENGKGTITFEYKNSSDEPITDPIQISGTALERINKLFETLNFLTSSENYQSSRDYGHLGNHTVTLRKDSQERIAKYNWTENKDAKALVDEYRKIGEQFIWYFDMNVSRQNQPLEAPGIVNRLESLIKRGEISDPVQMLPYLKDLSNDERIPLLARNHVLRVIKDIEKTAGKKDK